METTSSKDNNTVKNYIAFFDIDRTITKAISGIELARCAFRKGLMTRSDLAYAIYLSMVSKLNLRDPLKIVIDMVSWVKGMPEKTMSDLCSEVFREVLLPSVYADARSEIKSHQEKNAKVVILSSALKPISEAIAKNLGMDDIICSDLEVIDGYLTGLPNGLLCFGEEKAVRLKSYCEINNTKPSDAWYYGDSISDFPALCSVGNPICVNPDNKLYKAATKKNWKIHRWY
jgi:HAD superfamily hydrolase (TIGR01490 family)